MRRNGYVERRARGMADGLGGRAGESGSAGGQPRSPHVINRRADEKQADHEGEPAQQTTRAGAVPVVGKLKDINRHPRQCRGASQEGKKSLGAGLPA